MCVYHSQRLFCNKKKNYEIFVLRLFDIQINLMNSAQTFCFKLNKIILKVRPWSDRNTNWISDFFLSLYKSWLNILLTCMVMQASAFCFLKCMFKLSFGSTVFNVRMLLSSTLFFIKSFFFYFIIKFSSAVLDGFFPIITNVKITGEKKLNLSQFFDLF